MSLISISLFAYPTAGGKTSVLSITDSKSFPDRYMVRIILSNFCMEVFGINEDASILLMVSGVRRRPSPPSFIDFLRSSFVSKR
ncbi:hypothetical protein [Methanorbis rubei]|uniref:hypothetical protein n=1 Tax=Methanorbis rubei TaxID=3028300 RepID=UPI0030B87320